MRNDGDEPGTPQIEETRLTPHRKGLRRELHEHGTATGGGEAGAGREALEDNVVEEMLTGKMHIGQTRLRGREVGLHRGVGKFERRTVIVEHPGAHMRR